MLAHRVSQAYGLQTSTVDYEEGPGRVVGTRGAYTRLRQVRGYGSRYRIAHEHVISAPIVHAGPAVGSRRVGPDG